MSDVRYYHKSLNRNRVVHIVDADPATQQTIGSLFRLDGFETIQSLTVPHFISSLARHFSDVVLINLRIGEQSGLDVLRHIRDAHRGTLAFMLSDGAPTAEAVSAMKMGADDVFVSPLNSEQMLMAVQEALSRDVHLGPMQMGGRQVQIRGFSQLTSRERDVLELVVAGESNKSAAGLLGISDRTVEVHRARVMEKLGAANTAHLMRIVLTS